MMLSGPCTLAILIWAAVSFQPEPLTTSDERRAEVLRFECVGPEMVEVEVSSSDPFGVRDALLELQIGPVVSGLSRYGESGDLHTVIFILTREQLADISAPDAIATVRFDPGAPGDVWTIGPLDPATAQGCLSS
jgi:hypothetical protein